MLGRQVSLRAAAVEKRDGVTHPRELAHKRSTNEAGAANDDLGHSRK
jgi:hypothetical protein